MSEAQHELERRRQVADDAGDWQERQILAVLVDVADYTRRVGDHPESTYYRAEKAGALLTAAVRLQSETLAAYAGWPDEDGLTARSLDEAAQVLDGLRREILHVMWSIARTDELDLEDRARLRRATQRCMEWAQRQVERQDGP